VVHSSPLRNPTDFLMFVRAVVHPYFENPYSWLRANTDQPMPTLKGRDDIPLYVLWVCRRYRLYQRIYMPSRPLGWVRAHTIVSVTSMLAFYSR
jgi:hypothetical protein